MALLGIGEGVGATGAAQTAGGGAVQPVEGRKIRQIREGKGEGVVARSREIEDLQGTQTGGVVGVEGRLAGDADDTGAEVAALKGEDIEAGAAIDAGVGYAV